MYDEQHLPLTARKVMERRNQKLPKHLQKIIEEVGNEPIFKPIAQSQIPIVAADSKSGFQTINNPLADKIKSAKKRKPITKKKIVKKAVEQVTETP